MDKDIYIKKIGRRGKIKIWRVDGAKVRQKLEIEFTNFGQHFRFPFIPKYEFWIDREAAPNELPFFIEHLLTEWKMMKNGFSFNAAAEAANRKEQAEREKTKDEDKIRHKKGATECGKVHCRLLGKVKNNLAVWLVNGRLVRSNFDIEFTEGGHNLVYQYVPKNEVWIDDDLTAKERPYVIFHELFERSLMKKGLSYNQAHRQASKLEWQARRNREILRENLAALTWRENEKQAS